MSGFFTERLEPTSRVPEVQGQHPRKDQNPKSRGRPASPPPPAEQTENPDEPHQIDDLA